MRFVSGENKRERADADLVVIRGAASQPLFIAERFEEMDGGSPDVFELIDKVREISRIKVSAIHKLILIKSGQPLGVITREPQSAISKDSFRINHVTE